MLAASIIVAVVVGGVGPYQPLDTGSPGGGAGAPHFPAVSMLPAGVSLAVWIDTRRGSQADLFATRFTVAGVVLDQTGLPVFDGQGSLSPSAPAVANDGTNWLVVFQFGIEIRGVAVSAAGVASPAVIIGLGAVSGPAIVSKGGSYLVAWSTALGVRVESVSPAGVVAPGATVVVATMATPSRPALAANAAGAALLTWSAPGPSNRRLFGNIIEPSGALGATVPFPGSASGEDFEPVAASDGVGFTVVWTRPNAANITQVFANRVSADGGVELPAAFQLGNRSIGSTVNVTFDGTSYLVAFATSSVASVTQYGSSGPPAVAVSPPIISGTLDPVLAGNPLGSVMVASTLSGLMARGVTSAGALFRLDLAGNGQTKPAGVFTGVEFVVAWNDTRWLTADDLAWTRISPRGVLLTPPGQEFVRGGGIPYALSASFDSTSTLVNWVRGQSGGAGQLGCAAIPIGSGVLGADGGFAMGSSSLTQSAKVVATPAQRLVFWTDQNSLQAQDVDSACRPLGPARLLTSDAGPTWADATFDGSEFVIALVSNTGLQVVRVPLDGGASAVTDLGATPTPNTLPSIAAGPGLSLVAWSNPSGSRWARVATGGVLLDPGGVPVTSAGGQTYNASVVWTGQNFVMGWRTSANEFRARRVTVTGSELDDGGVVVAAFPGPTPEFRLIAGAGQALVLLGEYDSSATVRAPRVRYARLDLEPPAAPIAVVTPIPSGFLLTYQTEPFATVTIRANGIVVSTTFANAGGTVSTSATTPGMYSYTAQAVDELGNVGPPSPGFLVTVVGPVDAGVTDAGVTDAGVTDAGVTDAGIVDAGAPDAGPTDAGVPDAGSLDAGSLDAGGLDAGVPDSGAADAGVADAGVVDAGAVDSGVPDAGLDDAGVSDAGVPDAGDPDAGAPEVDAGLDAGADAGPIDAGPPDAATVDAGVVTDAGSDPSRFVVGCGCSGVSATPWALLLALLMRRRRG